MKFVFFLFTYFWKFSVTISCGYCSDRLGYFIREFSIFCDNVFSRPHRENGKRARDDRKNKQAGATFLLSLPIVARRAFFFLSLKSPFNKKGPLGTREKNALNSDSSVWEFFLESIIINIFTIEILRFPGNVGFKKLFWMCYKLPIFNTIN